MLIHQREASRKGLPLLWSVLTVLIAWARNSRSGESGIWTFSMLAGCSIAILGEHLYVSPSLLTLAVLTRS